MVNASKGRDVMSINGNMNAHAYKIMVYKGDLTRKLTLYFNEDGKKTWHIII